MKTIFTKQFEKNCICHWKSSRATLEFSCSRYKVCRNTLLCLKHIQLEDLQFTKTTSVTEDNSFILPDPSETWRGIQHARIVRPSPFCLQVASYRPPSWQLYLLTRFHDQIMDFGLTLTFLDHFRFILIVKSPKFFFFYQVSPLML